jgi:hypothetical protein
MKKDRSIQAIIKTLESYGVIQPNKGSAPVFSPTFINRNENQAVAESQAAALPSPRSPEGVRDFEDIALMLEADRKQITERNSSFEATPEGAASE